MPYDQKTGTLTDTFWGVVGGRLVSGFGHVRPDAPAQTVHAGFDIVAPPGTPIYAVLDGVVYRSRNGGVSGYHQEVTIRYDTRHISAFDDFLYVLYGHVLRDSIPPVGAKIRRGQVIAKVGTSADAMDTAPHVHLQMWNSEAGARGYTNGLAIDPQHIRRVVEPRVVTKTVVPAPTFEEATGRKGYRVVDLRGKVGSAKSNINGWRGIRKTKGVVWHYAGPATPLGAGRISVFDQLMAEYRYQRTPGLYSPGFSVNGLMYYAAVWEDTVYIVRDPDACLWHCKDGTDPDSWNYASYAVQVPYGEGQTPSARTMQTLVEFTDDLLRGMGRSRRDVRGHYEISATDCPGVPLKNLLSRFRAAPMPKVEPAKPETPKPGSPGKVPDKTLVKTRRPVDVGPYAGDSVARIDRYFASLPTGWDHVPYRKVGRQIAFEADRAGLDLALCCALVEQESGGRNVFGADAGGPFKHEAVTKEKVDALERHIRGGGTSQGVGLTQITYRDFIYEAQKMGGAELPKYQLRVGFELLRHHLPGGLDRALGSYNAGPGNWSNVYGKYINPVKAKQAAWQRRLS